MSAREIIAELPRLSEADLRAVADRIAELTSPSSQEDAPLRAKRVGGRLVLSGAKAIRQAEVEMILEEFP
jgi:hypothetical protein